MKTKKIKQIIKFQAQPLEIYDHYMDSKKHSIFTGAEAKISKKVGGKYTAYDGYIEGKNIKLVPGKLIIQTWRSSDFPEKLDSTITIKLEKEKTGTKMTFTHENVPHDQVKDLKKGWTDFYWKPLKKLFSK